MLAGFDAFTFNNGQCLILRFLHEDIEAEFYRSMVHFGGDCKLKRWISFFFLNLSHLRILEIYLCPVDSSLFHHQGSISIQVQRIVTSCQHWLSR